MGLSQSLFHEPWWLSAVTGNQYEEVTVKHGSRVVGRFPFAVARRGPFHLLQMPAFTHLLGPAVDVGVGKPQSLLTKRLSIVRDLIDQLPPFSFFKQVFDPSIADGLAMADGLAFQDRGFQVTLQYTFQIDCRNDPTNIWDGMHTTVRQHIRRAEEKYSVAAVNDPQQFGEFYVRNIEKANKINRTDFAHFANVFSECQARNAGEILGAFDADGAPAAMVFLAWGHGVGYYLLSTRAPDVGDSGSVSLLLWSAIKRAHKLKLLFDFDGVYSSGAARFLSGFGGQIKVRMIVTRGRPVYRVLRFVKSALVPHESRDFT